MSSIDQKTKLLNDNMLVLKDSFPILSTREVFEVLCELNERINSAEITINNLMEAVNARR